MNYRENQKMIQEEIKTTYKYLCSVEEKLRRGSRKDIIRSVDKLEAQARWLSILVGEIYK